MRAGTHGFTLDARGVGHNLPVSDAPPDPASSPAEEHDRVDPSHPAVPIFPPKPLLQLGYDRADVDEFVTKVVLAVHNERQTSVTADDVARVRFPSRRLGGGYDMREVDDYLGVAEALLRMRATARGQGPDLGPHAGGPGHHHPRTWWIYAIALVLVVLVVVFTLTQT